MGRRGAQGEKSMGTEQMEDEKRRGNSGWRGGKGREPEKTPRERGVHGT